MFPHHRTGPKEFLPPHVIQRGTRVLEDMELVEDDLRVRQHRAHRVEIRPMHVGAGGGDCRSLAPSQLLRQQRGGGRLVRSCRNPITSPCTTSDNTVQKRWPLPR